MGGADVSFYQELIPTIIKQTYNDPTNSLIRAMQLPPKGPATITITKEHHMF